MTKHEMGIPGGVHLRGFVERSADDADDAAAHRLVMHVYPLDEAVAQALALALQTAASEFLLTAGVTDGASVDLLQKRTLQ